MACIRDSARKDEAGRCVIVDVWEAKNTKKFAKTLQKYLKKKGYNTSITTSISQEENCPIIALCLLHSRSDVDIKQTLTHLNCVQDKQIILVLLHFKKKDKTNYVFKDEYEYENDYPEMTVLNCFLKSKIKNIKETFKDIRKDLETREIAE